MRFRIDNEYNRLEAVMVHRPGMEIERLTHENMRQFLFEDVPYLRRMQDEHDAFVAKMHENNIEVLYLENLVADLLADDASRARLIDVICSTECVVGIAEKLLSPSHWSPEELGGLLFAGLTTAEFAARTGNSRPAASEEAFLLPPIPNAYFMRDPAVVVRDAAISCKMHYRVRVRETLLTREVLEQHPAFRDNPITYGGSSEPTEDRPYTIEGGDVIILSPRAVLIGDSERTRSQTIERLAAKCFQFGQVERVYEIPIPTERAFMHLDTVFTIVDRGKVLCYPEVIGKLRYLHRYEPGDNAGEVRRVPEPRGLFDILREEFGADVSVIETGGGRKPYAAREQRMDGANALAIGPGVVIAYERNERTMAALEDHGVTCTGIDDSELVRGLGGPRCMTMPLRRAAAQ